ncbi:hypothetical protein ACTOI6_18910 (plasmid) [Komagataeibacter intermedius]|uniref:hypothetical protein n=1 Tax=Komagataeibacter intermedius TaxID=66229 RepID=UPI004035E9A7
MSLDDIYVCMSGFNLFSCYVIWYAYHIIKEVADMFRFVSVMIWSICICLLSSIYFLEHVPLSSVRIGRVGDNVFSGQSFDSTTLDNVVILLCIKDKNISQGTGTVIRDSKHNGHNRILTAYHVAANCDVISVINRYGHFLGNGRRVGNQHRDVLSKVKMNDDNFSEGDDAVIEMREKISGEYDQLRGLVISSHRPRDIFRSELSNPFGMSPGESGGPVLDINNQIIGVVSGVIAHTIGNMFTPKVNVTSPSIYWFILHKGDKEIKWTVRKHNTASFANLSHETLQALNMIDDVDFFSGGNISIIGYANNSGVIYHGRVE